MVSPRGRLAHGLEEVVCDDLQRLQISLNRLKYIQSKGLMSFSAVVSDDDLLAKLLELNLERAGAAT